MSSVSRTDQRIAQAARRDAERDGRSFSEPLHERVMAGVRVAAPPAPIPLRRSPLWLTAVAAALVLAAVPVLTYWMHRPHGPQEAGKGHAPIPAATIPSPSPQAYALLDTASRELRQRAAQWQGALAENQWAGLDHDLKNAAQFLLGRLPTSPPDHP